jgi:hypothetical protein
MCSINREEKDWSFGCRVNGGPFFRPHNLDRRKGELNK